MIENTKRQVLFAPFPKQQEFLDAVFSYKYSFIVFGGAIRGGKTYALLGLFILLCKIYSGSRWAIVRKDLPTIKKNLYPSWEKIKPINFIKKTNRSDLHSVTFNNGSEIIFFPESIEGDPEMNRWRGLEVNGFGFEEINECKEISLFKAFERAGSYVIPNTHKQPRPIIVATCNPSFGWVKNIIYEPFKKKELKPEWQYIQSRIYDNIPLLNEQPFYLENLKKNLNHFEYEMFVEGSWDVQIKTGGEFFSSFDLKKHLRPIQFDNNSIIHISIDSNVLPYIAVTIWQLEQKEDKWLIKQVHEILGKEPNNTAQKSGLLTAKWLKEIGYNQKVYMYGDRSTKSANNIDEAKRSFYQIFVEQIKRYRYEIVDRFLNFNPSVSATGDFINYIFDDKLPFEINISENCKESINDYIVIKKDENGNIVKKVIKDAKTGASFQEHSHLSDSMRYFIIQCFYKDFVKFQQRFQILPPSTIKMGFQQKKYTL